MGKLGRSITLALSIVLVGTAATAWIAYRHAETPLKDEIAASVEAESTACGDAAPLFVSLANNSKRTVSELNFRVYVRRTGHSDLLDSVTSRTDKILKPEETTQFCVGPAAVDYKFADLRDRYPRELEYTIEVIEARAE